MNYPLTLLASTIRFLEDLEKTVSLSDKLGFVYWFAVLTTISCGCATGVYVTLTNESAMVQSCQEKYQLYEHFAAKNQIVFQPVPGDNKTLFERNTLKGHDEINDLAWRIGFFEAKIR